MKNLIKIIALLLVAGVTATATTNAAATNDNLSDYVKTAEQFIMANPFEKVYLHMDNTSYFVDDTLWFKAYAVNAAQNKPTSESEILHVELLNPEGVVVRTQKYRLEGGKCDGSLKLDKELLSGLFEIRAYTKAMLNFGDQNYFTRVFPIFDGTQQSPEILDRQRTVGYDNDGQLSKELSKTERKQKKNREYSVQFYPEGGNLVDGVTSKVAFQVIAPSGEPLDDVECTLYENKSKVATSCSIHQGIGVFEITPNMTSKYYLKIDGYYERSVMPDTTNPDYKYHLNEDGVYERSAMSDIFIVWKDKKMEYELPEIYQEGCVVRVDCLSDANEVIIDVMSTYDDPIGVAIVGRGEVTWLDCVTGTKQLSVDKNDLTEGVNQVVLYDARGTQLALRQLFVRNNTLPRITIKATRSGENTPYSQQEIAFEVSDGSGAGVATDFSLSIYDNRALGATSQQNIYTSLLLSSELRGYIPNADYYFESEEAERAHNLDLIMMVHGWSRYKWESMSGFSPVDNMFEYEKGLTIYGRAYAQEWEKQDYYDGQDIFLTQSVPTHNITPYTNLFYIDYKAQVDRSVNKSSTLTISEKRFISNGEDNCFHVDFPDFTGLLNVYGSIKLEPMKASDSSYIKGSPIYITCSEYKPKERPYDFAETRVHKEVDERSMVDYPSVKVRYYSRGHFSYFYDSYRTSIYEPNVHTPYTSLENYMEYYDLKYIGQNMSYGVFSSEVIDNPLTSINELLYYNKMPYGTVCYISTLVEHRLRYGWSNEYITTPLKYEFLTVTLSSSTGKMIFAPKDFNFVIDSTIIHTSLEKRMKVYDKYKDHERFNILKISDRRTVPTESSVHKCPDYVVEYIGRKVTSPVVSSKPRRSKSPRVIVFQGFEETAREFYSPDYSVVTPPADGSDHRRTLYWNPNVESDSQGNATVTFYNNSQGGSYTIDAQTITADGQIGAAKR